MTDKPSMLKPYRYRNPSELDDEADVRTLVKPSVHELAMARLAEYESEEGDEGAGQDLAVPKPQNHDYERRFRDTQTALRASQKNHEEAMAQIANLTSKLEQAMSQQGQPAEVPVTAQQFAKFKEEEPESYNLLKTMFEEEFKSRLQGMETEISNLRETAKEDQEAKALNKLEAAHPDLAQILSPVYDEAGNELSRPIEQWLSGKSVRYREAFEKADADMDVDHLIDVFNDFKASSFYKKKPGRKPKLEDTLGNTGNPPPSFDPDAGPNAKKIWKRSEIQTIARKNGGILPDDIEELCDQAALEGRIDENA
jgi:hypothetical protein